MTPELQTVIALLLVVGAVTFLIVRWWNKRNKPGCGGDCGCEAQKKDLFRKNRFH